MAATHHRLSMEARGTFVFIGINILIFIMILSQKRTYLNPGPACPTTSTFTIAPVSRKSEPLKPWFMPRILQRKETGCYRTFLVDLMQTDISIGHRVPILNTIMSIKCQIPIIIRSLCVKNIAGLRYV